MAILNEQPTINDVIINELRLCGIKPTVESCEQKRKELLTVETSVMIDGQLYVVPNLAYYIPKIIQLPDGRQAALDGAWLDTTPPYGTATIINGDQATDVYEAALK